MLMTCAVLEHGDDVSYMLRRGTWSTYYCGASSYLNREETSSRLILRNRREHRFFPYPNAS